RSAMPPIYIVTLLSHSARHPHDLHPFPTRRSSDLRSRADPPPRISRRTHGASQPRVVLRPPGGGVGAGPPPGGRRTTRGWEAPRSEEHTSELQSRGHLVCRLLLEKKKTKQDECVV